MSALTKISETTMAGATSYAITSGIDATYRCYYFTFQNIRTSADATFNVGFSADGGSDLYATVKTSGAWRNYQEMGGTGRATEFRSAWSMGNDTAFQTLSEHSDATAQADSNMSGYLYLFHPSGTTYMKQYMWSTNILSQSDYSQQLSGAGRMTSAAAVNAVLFKTLDSPSATLDAGTITMWGLNTS
tara:strand:- start:92 stop:652 length:561 start_codon:yes stop_codon:yes gene_type:complete